MAKPKLELRMGRESDAEAIAETYLAAWRSESDREELLGGAGSPTSGQPPPTTTLAEQKDRFAKLLQSEDQRFVVAESSANSTPALCGFLRYGPSVTKSGYGEVMQLYVNPNWQRQGVGSRLLSQGWRDMSEAPWASKGMHVWCSKGNSGNRVYERMGWAPTGREKLLTPSLSAAPIAVVEYMPGPKLRPEVKQFIFQKYVLKYAIPAAIIFIAWGFFSMKGCHAAGHDKAFGDADLEGSTVDISLGLLVRVDTHEVGIPEAQCLDGSGPVYYYRRGRGAARNKWLLYFQGGGWCMRTSKQDGLAFPPALLELCEHRAVTARGSTRADIGNKDFGIKELFSLDPVQNPAFHDAHVVFLRYCDGTSFAGPAGFANFRAVLTHLLHPRWVDRVGKKANSHIGLSEASEVVVSGCSAGAVAAAVHADAVQRLVPNAFVVGLLDGGVFPDWRSRAAPGGVWAVDRWLRHAFSEHGVERAGALPPACLNLHVGAPWRCFFLEHLVPHVDVPIFLVQSRFDSSNVRHIDDARGLKEFGDGVSWRVHSLLSQAPARTSLQDTPARAAFLDSCFHHCMNWGGIVADNGYSQPKAFVEWYNSLRHQRGDAKPSVWDHSLTGRISSDLEVGCNGGPCWSPDRCSSVQQDLNFWHETFSVSALNATS